MQNQVNAPSSVSTCTPWNKGRLIGAKPPLRPKHVWTIRTKLQVERRTRDLAMFNLAIDSKLRGCDVVALKVEDVAPYGVALDRATVRQRKTGQPVRFELSEPTRDAVDDYIKATGKKPGDFLFSGRHGLASISARQYARLRNSQFALRQQAFEFSITASSLSYRNSCSRPSVSFCLTCPRRTGMGSVESLPAMEIPCRNFRHPEGPIGGVREPGYLLPSSRGG